MRIKRTTILNFCLGLEIPECLFLILFTLVIYNIDSLLRLLILDYSRFLHLKEFRIFTVPGVDQVFAVQLLEDGLQRSALGLRQDREREDCQGGAAESVQQEAAVRAEHSRQERKRLHCHERQRRPQQLDLGHGETANIGWEYLRHDDERDRSHSHGIRDGVS